MSYISFYELSPRFDSRKSFYGKAQIIEIESDTYLKSYDTIVCGIINGEFRRFWSGWSNTTGRHVNEFSRQFRRIPIGKKEWDAMTVYACEVNV